MLDTATPEVWPGAPALIGMPAEERDVACLTPLGGRRGAQRRSFVAGRPIL
jgi:hypothetical protein